MSSLLFSFLALRLFYCLSLHRCILQYSSIAFSTFTLFFLCGILTRGFAELFSEQREKKKKNQVRVLARLVFLLAVEHRFFPSSQPPMRRWLTAQSVVGFSSSYLCLKGFSCALQACVANRQLLSSSSKTSFFPLFFSPRLPFFFFFGSLITYSFTHPKLSPSSSDTAKLPVFLQHN